jgi:hypothetical protein
MASHGSSSQGMAAGGSGRSLGSEGIGTRIKDTLSTMANQVTGRGQESGTRQP